MNSAAKQGIRKASPCACVAGRLCTAGTPQAKLAIRLRVARGGYHESFTLDVDVQLPAQGVSVVFGASGAGKTTLLRAVAGLEPAARGRIDVAGVTWQNNDEAGDGHCLPSWRRPLGYVFQEASLFPHLDVAGNLDYALKRRPTADGPAARAEAIARLGIGGLLDRRPHQLSGGERQRVAIARALLTRPRLLLLDEPLASLDAPRKRDILPWLERLRADLQVPMLYVTHSADELARLADQVLVLADGRVRAAGPLAETLTRLDAPVLLGDDAGTVIAARIGARDGDWHLARADFAGGSLWLRDDGVAEGCAVRLRVLARDVSLATSEPRHSSIQNHLSGRIEAIADEAHPAQALVRVRCADTVLLARVTRRALATLRLQPGDAVWAQVKSVALVQ